MPALGGPRGVAPGRRLAVRGPSECLPLGALGAWLRGAKIHGTMAFRTSAPWRPRTKIHGSMGFGFRGQRPAGLSKPALLVSKRSPDRLPPGPGTRHWLIPSSRLAVRGPSECLPWGVLGAWRRGAKIHGTMAFRTSAPWRPRTKIHGSMGFGFQTPRPSGSPHSQ